MVEQYMNDLKQELNNAKTIIDKYGIYDIGYTESEKVFTYFVIMRSGYFFYITMGSTVFPDIDFNDIIYIRKHIALDVSLIGKEPEYFDTDIGIFNCASETKYDIEIIKKYGISLENEILTGNYD